MTSEQEDNFRKEKALQHIEHCKEKANMLRVQLHEAEQCLKRSREKYEVLFMECEQRAYDRKMAKLQKV